MVLSAVKYEWTAIVNVFAASKRAGAIWAKAEKLLQEQGVCFGVMSTGDGGTAMTLAFDACASGCRKFIAVGGDGTIHDVLNGIGKYIDSCAGSVSFNDFTIAVVPVGSGNDWIKTAGISRSLTEAAALIGKGVAYPQDVVRVGSVGAESSAGEAVSYMMNVAGVGLDARVCEIVNRKKKQGFRGRKLYVEALLKCIRDRIPSEIAVECDGREVFRGKFLSISFGTGKYSGGGMRQTPDAIPDDGLLDMTLIPDLPLLRIAVEAPKLFTGKFLSVKELVTARCKCVSVLPADGRHGEPVEVDGEVVGCAPVRFEVLDSRINVVRPQPVTKDRHLLLL